jgi:hypothetical protein
MSTSGDAGRPEAPKDPTPVVIVLGTKKPKLIKQMRRGKGKLFREVKQCIDELTASGVVGAAVQPVIVVVKERSDSASRCPLCRLMSQS